MHVKQLYFVVRWHSRRPDFVWPCFDSRVEQKYGDYVDATLCAMPLKKVIGSGGWEGDAVNRQNLRRLDAESEIKDEFDLKVFQKLDEFSRVVEHSESYAVTPCQR